MCGKLHAIFKSFPCAISYTKKFGNCNCILCFTTYCYKTEENTLVLPDSHWWCFDTLPSQPRNASSLAPSHMLHTPHNNHNFQSYLIEAWKIDFLVFWSVGWKVYYVRCFTHVFFLVHYTYYNMLNRVVQHYRVVLTWISMAQWWYVSRRKLFRSIPH